MTWYKNSGNHSDVVLSTRVRLARNLKEYPFPARLDVEQRNIVNNKVRDVLSESNEKDLKYMDMSELSQAKAISLAEKHLISPEFATNGEGRALILSDDEDVSIMLNEEDHIRIQVIYPGLSLDEAFERANSIDTLLDKKFSYAFDERIGYLTQCPTNLGTGMRASVMLHLPALARTGTMPRLATTVAKLGLTLRGAYGEGSEPVGDIYQLSNQVTLGISEKAALQNLSSIALQIVTQENQAREALVKDDEFVDKIWRAYGLLKNAYKMTSSEFIQLVSYVRLGVAQGIIDVPLTKLGELLVELQPATMNAEGDNVLTASERDLLRAKRIKEALA